MTGPEYAGGRTRLDAAIEALLFGKVRRVDPQGRRFSYYHVEGPVKGRKGGVTHRATIVRGVSGYCTCADFIYRGGFCYHMQAAEIATFAGA